jgi:hypothetical protein
MNKLKQVLVVVALLGVCGGAIAKEPCQVVYPIGTKVPTPSSTNFNYTCSGLLTPETFKQAGGTVPLPTDSVSDSDKYAALILADTICGSAKSLWAYTIMTCCPQYSSGPAESLLSPGSCQGSYANLQKVINVSQ